MSWARQIHIKNAAEIAVMREAGRINHEALAATRELLKPGVTTADLNAAAEEVLYHPSRDMDVLRSQHQLLSASMNNWCTVYRESES
jgi:Xaa-Pro aminopeptidase